MNTVNFYNFRDKSANDIIYFVTKFKIKRKYFLSFYLSRNIFFIVAGAPWNYNYKEYELSNMIDDSANLKSIPTSMLVEV